MIQEALTTHELANLDEEIAEAHRRLAELYEKRARLLGLGSMAVTGGFNLELVGSARHRNESDGFSPETTVDDAEWLESIGVDPKTTHTEHNN